MSTRGEVYCFGERYYTGHGAAKDVLTPRLVGGALTNVEVKAIAVGGFHTLALSAGGKVYTWGHNRVSQLGYPSVAKEGETLLRVSDSLEVDGGVYTESPRLVDDAPHSISQVRLYAE